MHSTAEVVSETSRLCFTGSDITAVLGFVLFSKSLDVLDHDFVVVPSLPYDTLITSQDIVKTGAEGHTFIKLDSGMTEVLRPSL
jgi:hypothetical protein